MNEAPWNVKSMSKAKEKDKIGQLPSVSSVKEVDYFLI